MMVLILPLSASVRPLLSLVVTMAITPSRCLRMVVATRLKDGNRLRLAQLIHSSSFRLIGASLQMK